MSLIKANHICFFNSTLQMESINWTLILGNLAPIIISVVAIVIALKNRKNVLRENLFDRQIDALMNIHKKFIEFENLIDDYSIETDNKEEFIHLIGEKYLELHEIVDVNELLLVNDVYSITVNCLKELSRLNTRIYNKERIEDKDYSNTFWKLEDVYREFIGTEKLSKVNKRLMH